MAPLPRSFSVVAHEIRAAIAEGRAEEAMQKLIGALLSESDDRAVRDLAAQWIERVGLPGGAAKALRQGRPELKEYWLEISEMVDELQKLTTYADAVERAAKHFKCSERHVQKCVAEWNRVKADHA